MGDLSHPPHNDAAVACEALSIATRPKRHAFFYKASTVRACCAAAYSAGQIIEAFVPVVERSVIEPAMLATEEALFNALVPIWTNIWDELLSLAQSLLAAQSGPGNGGIPVYEGNWNDSPLVVYANPFAGQVTAVQVGTFDFLYENNTVARVRLL